MAQTEAKHDRHDDDLDEARGPGTSAEGWMMLSRTMTEYDETKIKDCKEDMDTLLVFVS